MQWPGRSAAPQSAPGWKLQNMFAGHAAAPRVPQIGPSSFGGVVVALPSAGGGVVLVGGGGGADLAPHAATRTRARQKRIERIRGRYHRRRARRRQVADA